MSDELIYVSNPNFPERYISPEKLFNYLQTNYSDSILQIGSSTLGKPIYKLSLGSGDISVLAWSQMHGNESNSTLAMLDLLQICKSNPFLEKELFSKITLDFVWMLNPDGAEKWTRLNAADLDLNRDFNNKATIELPLLLQLAEQCKYDYALNLHEQRTVFSTDGIHPATLSFLAPSEDFERTITETRKKTMAVIAQVFQTLHKQLPHQIARYTDEFYPHSVGDNFTTMGIPTILFEGGHSPQDYLRKETRKYYTLAFIAALRAIITLNGATDGWEHYDEIPENKESHYDIIYRNVKVDPNNESFIDIAVQYKEVYQDGDQEITFIPIIAAIGNIKDRTGWQEIDCSQKTFKSGSKFPTIDSIADFSFE